MLNKNPLSMQIDIDDFLPATSEEKSMAVTMGKSIGFWQDGMRRLKKNKIAMASLVVILIACVLSFFVPSVYPYTYEQQIRGSENLAPMHYSKKEQEKIDAGEKVFPHILGTDKLGRDYAIRVMMGSRISLSVGLVASCLVLVIGATYGAIAGYVGGKVDMIMMRIVDMIYTVPDILIIVLLATVLEYPLKNLAAKPAFHWIEVLGPNLISMFIVFALLYWVGMARIIRSQILSLKQQEYVTAAKAMGATSGRIIRKHLLVNSIGTLIVTSTLQIPSAIFTESFLGFIGLGVATPMPSLGMLASEGLNGLNSYPYLLFAPALSIAIIILSFNLLGDGLRDAFDPKLKN